MEKILYFIKNNNREFIYSAIFSFLFMLTTIWGIALDNVGTIWVKYNILFCILIFFITFVISYGFLKLLPRIQNFIKSIKPLSGIEKYFLQNNKQSFINCFLFIAICHFPVFLAYFPGIFTYDTFYQANFFINHDYIEINPIIHNLLVYWTILFSEKFNTTWGGVYIYTFFQTTIMFLIFAYNIKILAKYNVSFLLKVMALITFAFYPTHQVFPLITTKDALFSAFILLYVIYLTELFLDKELFLKSKFKCFALTLTIFLTFLFRHNGFHAYIISIIPVIYFLNRTIQHHIKKILALFLFPLLLYGLFSIAKINCGIMPPPMASSLNVPIQQMGRVRVIHDLQITESDKEIYRLIISPGKEFAYNPLFADELRVDANSIMLRSDYIDNSLKENPKRFFNLYLKWFKEYPKDYIDAFLVNNYGYWYAFGEYKRVWFLNYYLITFNVWDSINGVKISLYNFNKTVRKAYDNIFLQSAFEKNPLTFILFSLGVNTWCIIIGFFILHYRKKTNLIIPLLIIPCLFFTVLFGPIVLLRYVYQNFLIIPILFAFCFDDGFGNVN